MSVSSVKNLNGETFSAVQDATLTDVVQTNSSNWDKVTNKLDTSSFSDVSGNFLTTGDSSNFAQKSDFTFVTDQWGTYLQKVSGKYIDYATRAGQAELDQNGHAITAQYFTTANANTLSSMLSGAIDYVSANAGGTTLTGDAQGAVNNVYTNSGKYVLNTATDCGIGNGCTATNNSFAQGYNNSAKQTSLAQGHTNTAVSDSLAQGTQNSANDMSFAQGKSACAYNHSLAQGYITTAMWNSVAVGNGSLAKGQSIAVGDHNQAESNSQAFGNHVSSTNSGMAIGTYNNITTGAFVIGNGNSNQRSDCFIIDHNGNVSACGKISANGVELGAGGGGGTTYTGDAQGALDKVYSNSGNWISTINNDASALFFAKKVVQGNSTLYGPVLSANANAWNDNSNYKFQIIANRLAFGFDDPYSHTSAYYTPTAISSRATSNGMDAGNWDWHLDYRGLGGKFSDNNENTATWSALRNIDIGLTTGGTISSISGHELTIGSVNNVVLTSTLPATPDANTLYLIPEA